jgi:hypothetical protein
MKVCSYKQNDDGIFGSAFDGRIRKPHYEDAVNIKGVVKYNKIRGSDF